MFLLIPQRGAWRHGSWTDLHSTMFLLIRSRTDFWFSDCIQFTFHNVSINTPSFTIPYTTSLILPFSVNLVIFFICRIQFLIILWKFFYFYNKTSPLSTSHIFCSIIGRQAYCEIDHIRFISSKSFLKQLMFACKIVMDSLFLYKYTILFEYFRSQQTSSLTRFRIKIIFVFCTINICNRFIIFKSNRCPVYFFRIFVINTYA